MRRIQDAFPNARVGNGFGLTETSSIATFLPHEWAAEHADSVGFAAPVVDLALDAPSDGVGELLVRGPNVVGGYWNKPDATAAAFVDGWLHTGDLARVDDGLVRVVDRAKDMINRGGENVYSVEVENALAGAPGVGEAAVVGVPDDVLGEKVGAVIVPLPGQPFDVEPVLAYLRERLADFKVPQYVALRGEPLPRNPGGKILKRALRETTGWGPALRYRPRPAIHRAVGLSTGRPIGRAAPPRPARVWPWLSSTPPPCRRCSPRRTCWRASRSSSARPSATVSSGSCSSTGTAARARSSCRSPACRATRTSAVWPGSRGS